jgi:four helix bundle protein
MTFGFQKLDVYQCAIEFLRLAGPLAERIPKGYGPLADQLKRACVSIPLNIAEGSGKFDKDARRFYAIARGSAMECASVIDSLEALGIEPREAMAPARDLLHRIVSMLTVMLRG